MANKDITETGVRSVLETMGIPSSFQGFKDNAIGRVEAAATVGSSMAGTMAGMGGSIFELMRSGNPQAALDQYRQIQEAMTYAPRTQGGLERVQQIGEFFEPVGQLYEQYGESVGESTGSPLAGEYAEEFLDPLFFLSGIGAIPKRASRVADAATDAVFLYDLLDEGEKLITHSGGKIDDIKREGVFDGIFGVSDDFSGYGLNNGDVQTSFAVKADKIAGNGDIDFDYDKSMQFLRKEFPEATGDEIDNLYSAIAEDNFSPWDNNVLERFGFNDPGEASFEAQRIRGKMASDQGFDAVAMSDESGTSYLLPFGSKAKKIAENGIPIADAAEGATKVARQADPTIQVDLGVPEARLDEIAEQSIRAYHGSPYDFEKFDLERIGSGEGAQMYGYGLYFAEEPDVARGYRKELSDLRLASDIQPVDADAKAELDQVLNFADMAFNNVVDEVAFEYPNPTNKNIKDLAKAKKERATNEDYQKAYETIERLADEGKFQFPQKGTDLNKIYNELTGPKATDLDYQKAEIIEQIMIDGDVLGVSNRQKEFNQYTPEAYAWFEKEIASTFDAPGTLFEVNIKASPDDLLDWEIPVIEQPKIMEKVSDTLMSDSAWKSYVAQLPDDVRGLATDMLLGKASAENFKSFKKLQQAAPDLDHNIITDLHEEYNLAKSGKNFYYNLAPDATGRYAQAEASKMAEELGIKGIKYKDQLSRGNRYELKLSQNGKPYDADPIYARSKQELDQLTDDYRQKGFDVDVEEAGTSNLVIFDPRIIDIAKKYGVAIPVAGAILMQSEGEQTAQPEA